MPSGTRFEAGSITCCHCGRVFIPTAANPRPQNYCAKCDHYTCNHAVCSTECNPIQRDLSLAQQYPDAGQPFILRGRNGEVLYDPRYQDKEKIF